MASAGGSICASMDAATTSGSAPSDTSAAGASAPSSWASVTDPMVSTAPLSGAAADPATGGAGSIAVRAVPQAMQNFDPASFSAAQAGHGIDGPL